MIGSEGGVGASGDDDDDDDDDSLKMAFRRDDGEANGVTRRENERKSL
jgi:hypothetical protein